MVQFKPEVQDAIQALYNELTGPKNRPLGTGEKAALDAGLVLCGMVVDGLLRIADALEHSNAIHKRNAVRDPMDDL